MFQFVTMFLHVSSKQSGGAAANISQGPLSLSGLTTSAGGFQKSLVPLRGGLSKPGVPQTRL